MPLAEDLVYNMRRTFKFKAVVNKEVAKNCEQRLERCCELYNAALEQRIKAYKTPRKSLHKFGQMDEIPEIKKVLPEFKPVDTQCLQNVLERLDRVYQQFFRRVKSKKGKAGYPRFKSHKRYDSFTLKQSGWKLEGKYLHLTNIGTLKLRLSRPIQGTIKTVTVKRAANNTWFVCFSCDNVPAKEFPQTNKQIGIDVGISTFCTDSRGLKTSYPDHIGKKLKQLKIRQRRAAKKINYSKRQRKAYALIGKSYQNIVNAKEDFLHKLANYYIKNCAIIYVEDLEIPKMSHTAQLGNKLYNICWGKFFTYLTYKAEEAGRQIIKVNPAGTSQKCSKCGNVVPKTLKTRVHECKSCGLVLDRDLNASLNILRAGQTRQALGVDRKHLPEYLAKECQNATRGRYGL